MNEQRIVLKQRRDLGEIIEAAVRIYIQNFWPLFLVVSVVLPLWVVAAAVELAAEGGTVESTAPLAAVVLRGVAGVLATAGVVAALAEIDAGRPATFSRAYDVVTGKVWRLLGAVLRVIAAIAAPFLLAVPALVADRLFTEEPEDAWIYVSPIESAVLLWWLVCLLWVVYLGIRWFFVEQAVILDGTSARAALSYSADAVTGSWWRVLGNLIVIWILITIPSTVIPALFSLAPPIVSATVSGLVFTATIPLAVTAATLLYMDLKTRKESDLAASPA